MKHSIPKPMALVLSYPVEPDGAWSRPRFLHGGRALAKKHDLIILSDLAYAEIYFDGNPPPSVLQVPGAIDIAVEFTSLSKTYAMPGWRMGFAVGNERLIAALARVKSYLDYGAFTPVQVAAAAALNGPQDCVDEIRAHLQAPPRRAWSRASAAPAGTSRRRRRRCSPGRRSRSPTRARLVEFSKLLIEKADVAVSPGLGFGEYGEGYVRLALVENEHRIRQAARNIRRFFETADKTLHNVVPMAKVGIGSASQAAGGRLLSSAAQDPAAASLDRLRRPNTVLPP